MTAVANTILVGVALLVALPVVVVAAQCLLALLPPRRRCETTAATDPDIAVLVPAHDEDRVIGRTLAALQTGVSDLRILVVADNCSDRTAEIARAAGVEVVERSDPGRRGKGFALDHGVRHLAADPPAVVVVVDADCEMSAAAVRLVARRAVAAGRPVQAAYYLTLPARHRPQDRISVLAFLVKNVVRPRGLDRLDLPCALTGTGMAFPWPLIAAAPLASGNIVEDLQLGLDLALAGTPPLHCREAEVTSSLPGSSDAIAAQRRRWEHGHLQTLLRWGPRLVLAGVTRGRPGLIAMGLDLAVPPLSLLVLLLGAAFIMTALGVVLGAGRAPLAIVAAAMALLMLAIGAAWLTAGRRLIPARSLLAIPLYVLSKIPIYGSFLRARQREWVSTARDPAPTDPVAFDLLGVQVHDVSFDEAVARIVRWCGQDRARYVVTPNVDHIMQVRRDPELGRVYAEAALSLADGMPLVWAASLLGRPLPDKVSGSDLFEALCREAWRHDLGVFLLGAAPGVAEVACDALRKRHPGLRIVGVLAPRLDPDGTSPDGELIAASVRAARPDLLFAAFGTPKQEYWMARHHRELGVPVSIGVGASFDFVAGVQRRAPRWMQQAGLEWLWRLAQDPRRLWRRYLVDDLPFVKLVAAAWWARRRERRSCRGRPAGR